MQMKNELVTRECPSTSVEHTGVTAANPHEAVREGDILVQCHFYYHEKTSFSFPIYIAIQI